MIFMMKTSAMSVLGCSALGRLPCRSVTVAGSPVLPAAVARLDARRSHHRPAVPVAAVPSRTTVVPSARHPARGQSKLAAAPVASTPAALAFTLAPAHGYVALSVAFAVFVHQIYMIAGVARARKKYNIPYPALYAEGDSESARTFNCVQRGHQNSLEGYAGFLVLLLVAGLKFPLTAAISGVVYSVGKILYFNGYASGDPKKRLQGAFSYFGLFTLLGCVIRLGFSLVLSA